MQLELARTMLLERSASKTLLATVASPRTASLVRTRILREAPLVILGKLHVASRGSSFTSQNLKGRIDLIRALPTRSNAGPAVNEKFFALLFLLPLLAGC